MTDNTPPEPGIYHDVPFDEYLAWPCVNNSSLSYAARSMAHYRYQPQMKQTDAMRFGSLVHCGSLEPEAIGKRYVVMPDFAEQIRKPDGSQYANVRASKQYRDAVVTWQASVGDREIITSDDLATMLGMCKALLQHDFARSTLAGPGPVEVCFVWDDPDSGIRCKCRADKWREQPGNMALFDLKTTRDASDFERSIAKFGYHRQAAFYADGARECTGEMTVGFGIVAVEKEAPYGVRGAMVGADAVQVGRDQYKRLLTQLAHSRATNDWPGYEDPEQWQLPGWAVPKGEELGLTLNGEVVL